MPFLLLLVSGVADLGRSFYFKTAATNVAREAAHWATLTDPITNLPPTDDEIKNEVAAPSQESFGISAPGRPLELAPPSVRNTNPLGGSICVSPCDPVKQSANPGPGCGQAVCNLEPDHAWLFVSPNQAGRTALAPNAHWTMTAFNSQAVSAPTPDSGGLQGVLRAVGGSLYPQVAEAASNCFTWSGLSISYTTYTIANGSQTPYQLPALTATVTGKTQAGPATSNKQSIDFIVSSPPGAVLQQTWSSTKKSTGSVDPSAGNSDTVMLSSPTAFPPGTYNYQVKATSSGGGCSVAQFVQNLTVTVNPGPSPSPSPTPSASPSPSPAPSPSPTGSPPGGPGPPPRGETITCTVIYYFTPVTPLVFSFGNAVYIVGTATLQATY